MKKKVALGMSGGVDSSLAAHLLVEAGHEVTGVYLECWRAPGCRTEEDRADALKVALDLKIPFKVLDFKEAYRDTVVEYFFTEYAAGRTPNPDVLCNKEIKFGLFYDWARAQGFDAVATGHYATIADNSLCIPADLKKDQTYFLYLLRKEQLEHIIFPLSHLTKEVVRAEAAARSLAVAQKKDSVGICFIGDINVHNFLKDRLGENPGPVVDTQGRVIGTHQGLWFYTIGQRHGFTIDKKTVVEHADGSHFEKENFPPFYIIKKIPEQNALMVGFGAETYADHFSIRDLHWIEQPLPGEQLIVRIRHLGALVPGTLQVKNDQTAIIQLAEAIQGIAEGQAAVIYTVRSERTVCLGGGIIA